MPPIREEVNPMQLSPVNAFMTRQSVRMLRRRAYTKEQFEHLAIRSEAVFYIGCPIWSYKEWVGSFFPPRTPPGDFLRLYSHKLTAVEGNTTFYAVPNTEVIARWRAETPPEFRFCPKIPRDISHSPALEATRGATLAFIERMSGLGERLGPIFLQLPPAFGPANLKHLETWLAFWPTEVRLAVEVRHPAFFEKEYAAALNTLLN